jgi:hypothetical protein
VKISLQRVIDRLQNDANGRKEHFSKKSAFVTRVRGDNGTLAIFVFETAPYDSKLNEKQSVMNSISANSLHFPQICFFTIASF